MRNLEQQINLIKIYLSGIWNNKRYILTPMLIVSILGGFIVSQMPNQYETKARIYADTTNILKPLLSGLAIQEDTQAEIMITSRTLLSREVREDIAQRSDLHLEYTTPEAYEGLIKRLKDEIQITGSKGRDIYDISFKHEDPIMAMRVVELTMKKFVDASAGKSREDAIVAKDFIEGQIVQYQKRLFDSEKKLATFKQENQLLLPGKGGSYYSQLSQLENEIETLQREIKGKEAQVDGFKNRFLPGGNGEDGDSGPQGIVVETPHDARLAALKNQLDILRIRYTDKHPNIIELKSTIESVEKLQVSSQKNIIAQASRGAITPSPNNNSGVLQEFSFQISALSSEIDLLKSKLNSSIAKRDGLLEMLNLIPGVEAELIELDRDYENNQRYYNDLVKRRNSAEISRSADKDTQNVKFKVIEEPRVSKAPVGPPRIVFYILVLFLSFGTGIVAAFLKSQISATVLSGVHLQSLIGKNKIIGMIEDTQSAKVRRKKKVKGFIFIVAILSICAVYGGLIAHETVFGQSPMMWLK